MRCPSCNAHNADGATFCTLCHSSFVAPPVVDDPAPVAEPSPDEPATVRAGVDESDAAAAIAVADVQGPTTSTKGTFRKTEEGFDWRCARCLEWNPLELTACSVCQLPFRDTMAGEAAAPVPDVSVAVVVGLSVVAPGLGHVAAGRTGTGVMRIVLFFLFLWGGLLLRAQTSGPGGPRLAVVPLLVGALVVWIVALVDANWLAQGVPRVVLTPRAYLWLLVAVLVLTLGAALPAIFRAGAPDTSPSEVPG